MGMCYVPDCDHTLKHGCSMFRFPTDIQLKQKWEKLIRRSDAQPTKFSVVCSCHFVENKKENLPTLFNRNKDKRFSFPSPETKKRRKISRTASQVAEIYFLKKEIEVLNSKLQNLQFSYDHIANDDNLISMYTGLPTCQMFDVLVNYLTSIEINYYSGWIQSYCVKCCSYLDSCNA
ncbi:hypothetical protein RN001_006229 [Aquatica leii]|uniref:THAP-type domain-containing protein n=1 Tax=Aquatica leii TaxID=1421715 RepID=A0AAN7P7M9_9COLE|nr:hypothetical protein RN001_006229 [Aquatica leii]